MHPAPSLIFFTVASGAGLGLLALLGLAGLRFEGSPTGFLVVGFGLAMGLTVAGLLSSTFHLGHPERAWRALSQWRSSWLSREGIAAVATLAAAALYALLWLTGEGPLLPLGLLMTALALATVWATGMIYAQIRAVDLWARTLTPICYLLFSMAGGTVLFLALHALFFGTVGWFLSAVGLGMLALAWAAKVWWWTDRPAPTSTTESATQLGRIGRTRLLEAPHTGRNYLLKEMGFRVARKHAAKLRFLSLALGAALPALLILLALPAPLDGLWLTLAAASHLAGMLAERWLFFAEARHAVSTWYDRG